MQDSERLTLNLPELARVLGISKGNCYSLAKQGRLPVPVIKLGDRRIVVPQKAVEDLLSRRQNEKTS